MVMSDDLVVIAETEIDPIKRLRASFTNMS